MLAVAAAMLGLGEIKIALTAGSAMLPNERYGFWDL